LNEQLDAPLIRTNYDLEPWSNNKIEDIIVAVSPTLIYTKTST